MSIQQMANALEYKSKAGIEKILKRNPYLRGKEFSGTYKLAVPGSKGGTQETIVFTKDGIMEVGFLSPKPKAREFRAWARQILNAFMDGELVWKEQRSISKEKRKSLTDLIAEYYPPEKAHVVYIHASRLICELMTGYKSIGSFKKSIGVTDSRSFPQLLNAEQLEEYNMHQDRIEVFLSTGFDFKELAAVLKGNPITITIETKKKEESK